jgi:hypothetical protein
MWLGTQIGCGVRKARVDKNTVGLGRHPFPSCGLRLLATAAVAEESRLSEVALAAHGWTRIAPDESARRREEG